MKRVGTREVWSLDEVTIAVWRRFEDIPPVWVEAEVQNLRPGGAQMWFTLAGGDAAGDGSGTPGMPGGSAMDASMSRVLFDRLPARPSDGTLVQAYGRVEFWRARSQVRLRVERLELAGDGLLRAQVAALRGLLAREGLLEASRKRPLPMLPRRIGLVTSAAGAAREDFLRALWGRFPAADVLLVDVAVQGDAAPPALVRAVRHLDAQPEVDVIVVARGGGSLEDLMAFNSEVVCRAIAGARTPVVAAVGHERDTTLCDEVADVRVSTPTAAAAVIVPDHAELTRRLDRGEAALAGALARRRATAAERVAARAGALAQALRSRGARADDRASAAGARLAPALRRVAESAAAAGADRERALRAAVAARERAATDGLGRAAALLELLSPARTVARGYAIVRDAETDGVLAAAAAARPGQALAIEMRDGRLPARVEGRGEGGAA